MRINDVTIENFRGIDKSRQFSFCEPDTDTPRRLSVLVGPNMSGKTTILDAIHLVFEAIANLSNPNFRDDFNPYDVTMRPDSHFPIRIGLRFSLQTGEYEAIADLLQVLGDPPLPAPSGPCELQIRWPPKEGVTKPLAKATRLSMANTISPQRLRGPIHRIHVSKRNGPGSGRWHQALSRR